MKIIDFLKNLFRREYGKCDKCKNVFKTEDLYSLTTHESHFLHGVVNPDGGLHTDILCIECLDNDSFVKYVRKDFPDFMKDVKNESN